jgi:Tfp pilus assembly protein PilO
MRYLFLIILIAASIGIYVVFLQPKFSHISELRTSLASYNEQLNTAKKLQSEREQLITVYNSIQKSDLDNLTTLLPDSVDNIRLIIQLDSIAQKNGLATIRNVAFSTDEKQQSSDDEEDASDQPYGTFKISFDTSGSYTNLLAFISDIEANLRLVDITDINLTPVSQDGKTSSADSFQYKVDIQTYWLKQ